MNKLNSITCVEDLKNLGICDCIFDPKEIKGSIMIPADRVLTRAEIAMIQATLAAMVIEDSKANRAFPIHGFVGLNDSTEDVTTQTFGYGDVEPVREGKYIWEFVFRDGGVLLSNNLRSFNGTRKYRPVFYDSQNTLIGTKKIAADGKPGLAGVPQQSGYPYTKPWKANDGTNLAGYAIRFSMLPQYINEAIAFVKVDPTDLILPDLAGLENVLLTIEEIDGDTVTVTAQTDCGQDMHEIYADELANEEAWVLKDENGDEMTITGVVSTGTGWEITADAEIPDSATLSLAALSVLAADPVNITGYESDTVEIDVGSGS